MSLGQYRTIRCHYESAEGERTVDVRLTHDGLGHRDWVFDANTQDSLEALPQDQRWHVEQQAIDGWTAAEAAAYDEQGDPLPVRRGAGAPSEAYYAAQGYGRLSLRLPLSTLARLDEAAERLGLSRARTLQSLLGDELTGVAQKSTSAEPVDSSPQRLHHSHMAKGSGGVGKSKGSASVSGAKAAPVAAKVSARDLGSMSLADFAVAVDTALDKVAINNMAPISQVYDSMPNKGSMSLDQFKSKLVDAYRGDHKVDLARNDLGVDRYSSALLNKSETDMSGRKFVFVRKYH